MPEPKTSSPIKPRTNVGGGVARRIIPEDAPEAEPEDIKVEEDATGRPVWHVTPTFEDQWTKYPNTCRPGPLQFKTFSLPDQEDALNEFLQKTVPATAPQVRLVSAEKQGFEGAWSMLLAYHEIKYKKLLDVK